MGLRPRARRRRDHRGRSAGQRHGRRLGWRQRRHRVRVAAGRGGARLGVAVAVAAETGEVELLIRIETNYQAAPVVAPHGGVVAYITDASGNNDLYAVPSQKSPRGIQPVRLTHSRTDEYFPSWSPDGEHLVYARNGGTDDQPRTIDNGMGFALYTVTRGGGEPKRVRDRRIRLVGAHRAAAGAHHRFRRRTPTVAHLSAGVGRTQPISPAAATPAS